MDCENRRGREDGPDSGECNRKAPIEIPIGPTWAQFVYEHLDAWGAMASGYRLAAEIISEHCEPSRNELNELVFPLLFLVRHFIELTIKELLSSTAQGLPDGRKVVPEHHDLCQLWKTLKERLPARMASSRIQTEDGSIHQLSDEIEVIERWVKSLNDIDKPSSRFRYPREKNSSNLYPFPSFDALPCREGAAGLRASIAELERAFGEFESAAAVELDSSSLELP